MAAEPLVRVIPVMERLRFDEAGLERYLRAHVVDFAGPPRVEQFELGQSNPTYLITAGDRCYVLRRKPPGKLLPSAHAIEREYQVMTALMGSGVPAPRTYGLCEDPGVIGTPFYLMEYVAGRTFEDFALSGLTPAERSAVIDDANRIIAKLHGLDYQKIGLAGYGRAGNYIARQVSRWTKQYRASETERIEAMERLMEWLPAHIPEEDDSALVHGDFHFKNIIVHPTEPRIVAVLDWELSTIGNPLADFAYVCMRWRLPLSLRGMAGLDFTALGIPSEAAYVADYCRRTGRTAVRDWDYYIVFNLFRSAAILQGIMGRIAAGNAANKDALETGSRARAMAELAWQTAQEALGAR